MLKSYFWIVTTCYIGGIATYPQFHVPDDSTLAWQFASVQLFFRRLGAWDCYTSGLPHPRCKIRVKRCGKTMGRNPRLENDVSKLNSIILDRRFSILCLKKRTSLELSPPEAASHRCFIVSLLGDVGHWVMLAM